MIRAEAILPAGVSEFLFVVAPGHPLRSRGELVTWKDRRFDVTSACGVPVEKLGGQPSAKVIEDAFSGGKVVKGFNHLAAGILGQSPDVKGGRRVMFLASDDEAAATKVGALAEELGFAPINLGASPKAACWCRHAGTNGDI